jgi:hypothetical protein
VLIGERSKRMAEVVMDIRQVSPRRQNLLVETDRLGELSGAVTRERVIAKFEERIRQRPEVDSTNRTAVRQRARRIGHKLCPK